MRAIAFLLAVSPALVAVWAPVWSGAGASSQALAWVAVAAVLGALLFPQGHTGETRAQALRRSTREVFRDPFTYAAVALVALLAVPLFNVGLCPGCDAAAIAAGANPRPPREWLPFCVSREEHASVLRWFAAALGGAFALRHALVLKWRRVAFETLVWNSAAVSAVLLAIAAS